LEGYVMLRTLAVTTGLIILVSGLCAHAAENGAIEKPVWRVGDSWRVTWPRMARMDGVGAKKIGEDALSIRVRETTQFRGVECYVLQFDPVDDTPPSSPASQGRISIRAFYTVSDLKLVRLEKRSADAEAKLLIARNAHADHPIVVMPPEVSIPLLLPVFPLSPGQSAVVAQAKHEDEETRAEEKAGRNALKANGLEMDVQTPSAAESQCAGPGAVKVRFWDYVDYSLTGRRDRVLMEQVWAPGRPWWSSVRVYYPPGDKEGIEVITAW
jgi:hypothetical protein